MLVEDSIRPDLMVLRSPLLSECGVPHAFSTRRAGGLANDAALSRAAGLPTDRLLRVHQVHGAEVHRPAPPGEEPMTPLDQPPPFRADALVGDRPGDVLRIITADCVPVLLATEDGRAVAAVHAGWRGLLAGVLEATLRELTGDGGAVPLVAAIGPCLSQDRFEVGPEVGAAFEVAGHGAQVVDGLGDRRHVDLTAVAAAQLRTLGVRRVDVSARCTWGEAALFHSYRRDVTHGGARRTGRQLALITAAPR